MCCAGGGIWKCGSITLRGDFCPFKCDTYLWMPWWHAWCGFWANLTEEAAVKAFGNTHCHRPAENTEGAIVCCIYCMAVGASRSVYTKREREGERLVNHYLHWILNLGHSTSLWARCFTEVATAFVQEQWLGTVTRQFLGRFLATLIRVVKWSSQRMQCRMQRPVAKRGDHLWPTRCNCRLLSQHPRL